MFLNNSEISFSTINYNMLLIDASTKYLAEISQRVINNAKEKEKLYFSANTCS